MHVRTLLLMLIAVAMAMTPLAMPGGATMAAQPDHHGAIAETGHCPDQPKQSQPIKADKDCCVAGCMAVAALPAPAEEPAMTGGSSERPSPDRFRRGYLGEIATPPPRFA